MIPFNIEPILIDSSVGKWEHPTLETLLKELQYNKELDLYESSKKFSFVDISVIMIVEDVERYFDVVSIISKNSLDFLLRSENNDSLYDFASGNLFETLIMKLVDYSWVPKGTKVEFNSTEYGNAFLDYYNIEHASFRYHISTGVCVHNFDNEDWDYSV